MLAMGKQMTIDKQAGRRSISKGDIPEKHRWALDRNTPADAQSVEYYVREAEGMASYGVVAFDGAEWKEFSVMVRRGHG